MKYNKSLPVYFISHGGGPWPWLEGNFRKEMVQLESSLKQLPHDLPYRPKAILMISGHWEEEDFKIMSGPRPGMIYDYGGFPEHTYKIKYEAPGSPELAERVKELIGQAHIKVSLDPERGFDHGAFVPLFVSYPNADIPVVQLSIRSDYDPGTHFKVGQALAPLREEGILIIASGLSYHNLSAFNARAARPSHEFDSWLQETIIKTKSTERYEKLRLWENAPSARLAHPQEDHLIPLMVATGAAADDDAELCYHDDNMFGGIAVSSFMFGKK